MDQSEFWFYDRDLMIIKNHKTGLALGVNGNDSQRDGSDVVAELATGIQSQ